MFSAEDLRRIQTETFVTAMEHHAELDSTNNRALAIAAQESHDETCVLVLTSQQTAGRGRGKNRWWSDRGSLTFSLLLNCKKLAVPVAKWPQTSLLVGLAVCDCFDEILGDATARVKWPNDVYLDGRKACGILIESADYRRNLLVVGVGVNVNNSATSAPHPLRETAISLSDVAQKPLVEVEVLVSLLRRVESRLKEVAAGQIDLRAEWRPRCLLTGRSIEVLAGDSMIAGRCLGIDQDGALVLETPNGPTRLFSGVVTRVA